MVLMAAMPCRLLHVVRTKTLCGHDEALFATQAREPILSLGRTEQCLVPTTQLARERFDDGRANRSVRPAFGDRRGRPLAALRGFVIPDRTFDGDRRRLGCQIAKNEIPASRREFDFPNPLFVSLELILKNGISGIVPATRETAPFRYR